MTRPNFLFIGPDKSGSTWIYHALRAHSEVYLSPVKGLFFFDRFFDRGMDWYQRYFSGACASHLVIGEISHDYLFSRQACSRILSSLPHVKLMVCLREPVDRAFSAYLYMLKQGRLNCDFETALDTTEELVDHGLYAKYLKPYMDAFGRNYIQTAVFDDLVADPQRFYDDLCRFLGLQQMELSEEAKHASLLAVRPRSVFVAGLTRRVGWRIREKGYPRVVSAVKEWSWINRLLFKPFTDQGKPKVDPSVRARLEAVFCPDIHRLDAMLNSDLARRWGYRIAEDATPARPDGFSRLR